jgi:tetratricopeptide (TPR) repeat protein
MKLVLATVLAAIIAAGSCLACLQLRHFRLQAHEGKARSAALVAEIAAVRAAVAAESARRERLEARLTALEATRASRRELVDTPEEPAPHPHAAADTPAAPDESAAPPRERVEAAVATLTARETKDSERQALWTSLGKDGLLDETLRAFEARVEAEPRNPDRHAELGAAYVQKILTVGDLEKGSWAMKADRAFDRALELDPSHWEARFTKAASLAYWPPIFGKSAEAARHFETLIAQQESRPAEPRFATTYLFLGNLYHNQGSAARARETWARGVQLFPADAELKKQLTAAGGAE